MFSKEIYKKQNGKIYYILSIVTLVFFVYGVSVVLRGALNIPLLFELGDFAPVMGIISIIGIIGFPLVLALNKGMKNLYVKSKLKLDDNKIVYDRQVEYEWTAVGHLNTKNIYEISKFDDYKITSRWIILYGILNIQKYIKEKTIVVHLQKLLKLQEHLIQIKKLLILLKRTLLNNIV